LVIVFLTERHTHRARLPLKSMEDTPMASRLILALLTLPLVVAPLAVAGSDLDLTRAVVPLPDCPVRR
jgi:hypothetical protein